LEGVVKDTVCVAVLLTGLLAAIGPAHSEPVMQDSIVRVGACATPGVPWQVFVQDSFAYVADRSRITAVNVSDPANPWVVGSVNSGPPIAALGLCAQDSVVYCNLTALGGSFITISVADPESLYLLGECVVPTASGEDPTGVVTIDSMTFLANGDDGLTIIDVSDPSSPTIIDSFNTPGYALDLCIRDTLAFIADYDSLQVIGVADPTNPYRVGAVGTDYIECYGISVKGDYAYLGRSNGEFGRLEVVSITDPSSPQVVASVGFVGYAPDVCLSGDYAYLSAADYVPFAQGGVRVVYIADPLNPILVASYDTPGDPHGVFAVGDLIYVADYDSLQILRHISTGIEEDNSRRLAPTLSLQQNHPNPFSRTTSISYVLPAEGEVTLTVHDVAGRLVARLVQEHQGVGSHTAHWDGMSDDGTAVLSGVYFYRLIAGGTSQCRKMVLVR
jgi:hypothetical protein